MLREFLFFASLTLTDAPTSVAAPVRTVNAAQSQQADAQEIIRLIARQYEAANARDFDGYMAAFWHSPLLVYVVDGAVWTGWAEARGHLEREYPSRDSMGRAVLERLQANFVDAETAVTVEYWTVYFSRNQVHGVSVGSWRKLQEGWRMVQASTNSIDLR